MSNPDVAATAARPQLSKKLPTFRVGFSKQMDALRAYAMLSDGGNKPVHYSRVAEIIKVHEANVSSMNPFFLENGFILKATNGHLPAPQVVNYNRAFSWNQETAAGQLRALVGDTWFGMELTQRLSFRAMSEDAAIEVLAGKCNAGPEAKPQLRILIDFSEAAGVVARANGQLTLGAVMGPEDLEPPLDTPKPESPAPAAPPVSVVSPAPARHATEGGINFDVSINVSMAEMRDWTPERIASFFAGMAQVLAAKNG